MSLILEALRKSEAERRRGQVPDVYAELPPAARSRGAKMPAWPWLAVAAVLVAGIAWWMRDDAAPKPASARGATIHAIDAGGPSPLADRPPATPASQPPIGAPPPPQAIATPPAPGAVEPAMDGAASPATGVEEPTAPLPAAPAPPPAATASLPAPTPLPAARPALPPQDRVAMINSLPADQRKALPPLKLTMHLWDEVPAQRFVILDGQRLGEGGRIGELVVDSIQPDAVLFDWNGRKLRLPLR